MRPPAEATRRAIETSAGEDDRESRIALAAHGPGTSTARKVRAGGAVAIRGSPRAAAARAQRSVSACEL